jgi:peroxisomal enoyl-CoA hydratase 2
MSEQPSIITPELRATIGVESRPVQVEIERSAIRKYADAIQDPNPVYYDESFARRTPHGTVIAPPTFVCSLETGGEGLEIPVPATHTESLNGGVEYRYERPLRLFEVLTVTHRLTDVFEKDGRLGRMLFLVREEAYRDRDGRVVASQTTTGIRYAKPEESQQARQATAARPPTPADDRVVPDLPPLAPEQRLQPRSFEDVAVGDILPPLPKCPTLKHLVMYAGASGNFAEYHYDPENARELGMPGLILHGNLKIAYLGQIVTDWIGTHGSVVKLAAQIRGMDLLGDLCLVQGTVTKTTAESTRGLVEIDLASEAPGGRRTVVGSAVVALPLRDSTSRV